MAVFNAFKGDNSHIACGEEYLGRYAVSLAGHDAGKIYLVVSCSLGASYARSTFGLADGGLKKAAKPKLKKGMHLRMLPQRDAELAARLLAGGVTDAELVHSIKRFKAADAEHRRLSGRENNNL